MKCKESALRIWGPRKVPQQSEDTLWGEEAGAQGQSESRSEERLLRSSVRTATRERTWSYVTVQTAGCLTQLFAEQGSQFAEGNIRMKNKEGTLSTGA